MLKKVALFLFLFIIYNDRSICFIKADELNMFTISKKYNLSICAIFKNEAKYLKEWIEYHRIFGVDHFYLYDIGSRDSFQNVLSPYIRKGLVTLIHWPEALSYQEDKDACRWALSTQIPAYENAVNFIAKNETKWLVFVDIDEFLVCPKENIAGLLKKYDDTPGISFSSDFFNAARQGTHPKNKLLIQSLERTSPPTQIVDKSIAKIIFKPDQCKGFTWPPYQCRFKTSQSPVPVDRQELRINRYINRDMKYSTFGKKEQHMHDVDYTIQSEFEIAGLLKKGYVIEDQECSIYQYVPELLKRMGQEVQ